MNTNGLTQQDIKQYKELLTRANNEQLRKLLELLQQEFLKRT